MNKNDLRYQNVFRCDSISAVDGFLPVRDVLKLEMFGDEGDKGFRNFDGVLDELKRLIPKCDDHFMEMLFESIQDEQLKYDDEYRYVFVDYLIKLLISECGIPKEYFNYGIWACESPKDVVDSYNVSIGDVSKYKIKGVKLQDLGEEGALYGCEKYPEEVFEECVTKKVMDFDFNEIFNVSKLQEKKVSSNEENLDVVYKWLPFLKENKEIIALDTFARDRNEPLEILFDCKSKGKTVDYKENPEIYKAVSFRNQAKLIEDAMDEFSEIMDSVGRFDFVSQAHHNELEMKRRNEIVDKLSIFAQKSTHLNYLFLQTVAPSVNKYASKASKSKYIQNIELKKAFLKGMGLDAYENLEAEVVLFGYLIFILGNTLFNAINGTSSREGQADNSAMPLDKSNERSFIKPMLKQLKAHPFDEYPTFIPTVRKSNDGSRGYLGYNYWAVKLAQGEITEEELKELVDEDEFKAAMEDLPHAQEKWSTQESPEPIALLRVKYATAAFNNQIRIISNRAISAEKKQQKAEEKFLADQAAKAVKKPYSSEEEKLDLEDEYENYANSLCDVLLKNTKKISDDPKVWVTQTGKMLRKGEMSFAPQFVAFIACALLNPDATLTKIFVTATGYEGINDIIMKMPNFGFKNHTVKESFLQLQKMRSLINYSEKALNIFDRLILNLEKISGIKTPRESLPIWGGKYNKVWADYGEGLVTNTEPRVGKYGGTTWFKCVKGVNESMTFDDNEFEKIFNECVTAGGMGGCINNFVPQNVLAVTDTKMGAISPGVTKGKITKSGENPAFENDSMKVHKKGKKKGDAITGTGIVYAKNSKLKESYDDDPDLYDDLEDEYGSVECSRCGAPLSSDDDYASIRGDIYCMSCAESEMRGCEDEDNEEPEDDYIYDCPGCGKKYDLHDPKTFGIAKGKLWCTDCANKRKE